MSTKEYDLPTTCPVKRCEKGLIYLNPMEMNMCRYAEPVIICKECNGLGKLPDLELETA